MSCSSKTTLYTIARIIHSRWGWVNQPKEKDHQLLLLVAIIHNAPASQSQGSSKMAWSLKTKKIRCPLAWTLMPNRETRSKLAILSSQGLHAISSSRSELFLRSWKLRTFFLLHMCSFLWILGQSSWCWKRERSTSHYLLQNLALTCLALSTSSSNLKARNPGATLHQQRCSAAVRRNSHIRAGVPENNTISANNQG